MSPRTYHQEPRALNDFRTKRLVGLVSLADHCPLPTEFQAHPTETHPTESGAKPPDPYKEGVPRDALVALGTRLGLFGNAPL